LFHQNKCEWAGGLFRLSAVASPQARRLRRALGPWRHLKQGRCTVGSTFTVEVTIDDFETDALCSPDQVSRLCAPSCSSPQSLRPSGRALRPRPGRNRGGGARKGWCPGIAPGVATAFSQGQEHHPLTLKDFTADAVVRPSAALPSTSRSSGDAPEDAHVRTARGFPPLTPVTGAHTSTSRPMTLSVVVV
jgi:hypothetical protein